MYPKDLEYKFYSTSVAWHEIDSKVIARAFKHLVSKNLRMSDYSDEVKQYQFLFIAVQPDNRNHDNWRKYYSKARNVIYNNLKLDYERLEKADQIEANQMQAELYLKGIFEIPTLRGMRKVDFDAQRFYEDARYLFIQQGWLRTESQAISTSNKINSPSV